jgi:hypothetical protein
MTSRALARLSLIFVGVGLAFGTGCSGCGDRRPPPGERLARGAEAVIELPDIGIVAARREAVLGLLEGVATPRQLQAAQSELERALGFDPTTLEGLKAGGLARGPAAIEVLDGGRGALWVLPIEDEAKVLATVETLARSRVRIDEKETRSAGGRTITVLGTAWGDEVLAVVSIAFDKKQALIGVGRRGPEAIAAALVRTRENSVLAHPEYAALDRALGTQHAARFLVTTATAAAARVAGVTGMDRGPTADLARSVRSVGWGFGLDAEGLKVQGRLRLDEHAKARLSRWLAVSGETPPGVRGVGASEAALVIRAAGDPRAFLEDVLVPGSPLAARFEENVGRLKLETGLDVRGAVLPKLGHHAAFALGVGDLSGVTDLRALSRNPLSVAWLALAIDAGPEAKAQLDAAWPQIDPALTRAGLVRGTRKLGGAESTTLTMPNGAEGTLVLESAQVGGAWLLSNDRGASDRIAAGGAAPDPTAGRPGLYAELRLGPVARAARSADLARIGGGGASALVVQAFVARILGVLDRLDTLSLAVTGAPDGLDLSARLRLAETGKK